MGFAGKVQDVSSKRYFIVSSLDCHNLTLHPIFQNNRILGVRDGICDSFAFQWRP